MKNQFDDTVNGSPLDVICFKQIKSFDRKTLCNIQYSIYGCACFASWVKSCAGDIVPLVKHN